MRRSFAVLPAVLATIVHAGIGGPVFETKLPLTLTDSASGKPVVGTTVLATESFFWTGFHASGNECFRAATTTLKESKGALALPATLVTSVRWDGSTRSIEVTAFHEDYCAERPYTGPQGFFKWATRDQSMGGWEKPPGPKPGELIEIKLIPSTDGPERRLRHLLLIARSESNACEEKGREHLALLRKAVVAEAAAVAHTRYEKYLAGQVEQAWDGKTTDLWVPLSGLADDTLDGRNGGRWLLGYARAVPNFDKEYIDPQAPRVTNRLLHEGAEFLGPFDIDARDGGGFTPLMHAAKAMQPESVRFLLENGARADVITGPDGFSAMDLVLSRAMDDMHEAGTQGQELHLLRMIGILVAARPTPTLRGDYREELDASAQWKLTPHLRDFWTKVRDRVASLEIRPVVKSRCAISEVARRSLGLTSDHPEQFRRQ